MVKRRYATETLCLHFVNSRICFALPSKRCKAICKKMPGANWLTCSPSRTGRGQLQTTNAQDDAAVIQGLKNAPGAKIVKSIVLWLVGFQEVGHAAYLIVCLAVPCICYTLQDVCKILKSTVQRTSCLLTLYICIS